SFQSTGDTISFSYIGPFDCVEFAYEPFDITVECSDCLNPQADFTVIPECDSDPQFLVDVDLTALGSGESVVLSDNQGSANQVVSDTGTYTFGPYPEGTEAIITATNNEAPGCSVQSDPLAMET